MPSVAEIAAFTARIAQGDLSRMTDVERVDFLTAGEVLKAVVEGAQSDVTSDFVASQRAEQARAGVYTSVAPQVGVVRRSLAMELYVAEGFGLAS